MDAAQPVGLEERLALAVGLARRADPLEPVERPPPERPHAVGIGRHEPQLGAARERLPEPHPRHDAERLGRRRHLAHHLPAPRLGRQRHRLAHQLAPAFKGGHERESGEQDADDHVRTHVRIWGGGLCRSTERGELRPRLTQSATATARPARTPRRASVRKATTVVATRTKPASPQSTQVTTRPARPRIRTRAIALRCVAEPGELLTCVSDLHAHGDVEKECGRRDPGEPRARPWVPGAYAVEPTSGRKPSTSHSQRSIRAGSRCPPSNSSPGAGANPSRDGDAKLRGVERSTAESPPGNSPARKRTASCRGGSDSPINMGSRSSRFSS